MKILYICLSILYSVRLEICHHKLFFAVICICIPYIYWANNVTMYCACIEIYIFRCRVDVLVNDLCMCIGVSNTQWSDWKLLKFLCERRNIATNQNKIIDRVKIKKLFFSNLVLFFKHLIFLRNFFLFALL